MTRGTRAEAPKQIVSVGAVVLNDAGKFLLVHKRWTRAWEFPRGGVERGESLDDTLQRELAEEIGARAYDRLPGFHERIQFPFSQKGIRYAKTVHFFLVRFSGTVRLSDEHTGLRWCTAARARTLIPHTNERHVLARAVAFIQSHS